MELSDKSSLPPLKTLGENRLARIRKDVLDSLSLAIIILNDKKQVIGHNKTAFESFPQLRDYQAIDELMGLYCDNAVWGNWQDRLEPVVVDGKELKLHSVEFKIDGNSKIFQLTAMPLNDQQFEKSIGAIITLEDITEAVEARKQLETIERFAAVGKLAGKVAHELNNPIDGILRYLNLAMRILETEKLQKPIDYLNKSKTGLMRMVQIISELLDFSRNNSNPINQVSIESIIEDSIKTLEHRLVAGEISIQRNYQPKLPSVREGNLYQVFCNLLKNSMDAMQDQGEISIATSLDNEHIKVIFSDNGPGVSQENLNKIFDPFFTTKKQGKGTGLGLAICKDIIEKYNGRITAQNRADQGCEFIVILPIESKNN